MFYEKACDCVGATVCGSESWSSVPKGTRIHTEPKDEKGNQTPVISPVCKQCGKEWVELGDDQK